MAIFFIIETFTKFAICNYLQTFYKSNEHILPNITVHFTVFFHKWQEKRVWKLIQFIATTLSPHPI